MSIEDLDVHRSIRENLARTLSGQEIAEKSFRALVKAGCDPTRLALHVTEPRQPKQRKDNADGRKVEKQELRAMARTFKRLARQTRAVLARHRYFEEDLLGCYVSVSIRGFPRLTGKWPIDLWFERWGMRVGKLAERPILKLLLNPRDMQRLSLMEYIRGSTGKPHYARVADLLNAAEAQPEAEAQVTEGYLKKIDGRLRTNQRKWREGRQKEAQPVRRVEK